MPIRIEEKYDFPTANFVPGKPVLNDQESRVNQAKSILEKFRPELKVKSLKVKVSNVTAEVKAQENSESSEVKPDEKKEGLLQKAQKFLQSAILSFKIFMQKVYIPYGNEKSKHIPTSEEKASSLKTQLKYPDAQTPLLQASRFQQLGRELSRSRTEESDHSEAIKAYESAVNSYRESLNTDPKVQEKLNTCLKELAILTSSKKPLEKVAFYEQISSKGATPFLLTSEKYQLAEAYQQAGKIEEEKGALEQAKKFYGKSMELFESYVKDMESGNTVRYDGTEIKANVEREKEQIEELEGKMHLLDYKIEKKI